MAVLTAALALPGVAAAPDGLPSLVDTATAPVVRVSGSTPGSGFGGAGVAVGDVYGDGRADLVVGAPEAAGTRGELYCFFGTERGLESRDLSVLDADLTVFEQMQREFPLESIGLLRNLLGAFQFSGDDVDKKVRALSGGEKSRLAMARMLLDPPNFLVLDEPTNHLDLATKDMLVSSLGRFDGTMIFVSHDRAFLRGLSNRVLELGGESGLDWQPHAYPGSYVEYVARTGHEAPGVHR